MQISTTASSSFNEQLQHVAKNKSDRLHLTIHKLLSDEELSQLLEFAQKQKPFPFRNLALQVDHSTLKNPLFLEFIKQLNELPFSGLELLFKPEELEQFSAEITDSLTDTIAPLATYPVQVNQADTLELDRFQNKVIANIQKRHKEKGIGDFDPQDGEKTGKKRPVDPQDPMSKKIKLKELIAQKKLADGERDQYIHFEIEHVEVVEQQIAQEEVVEVKAEVELHDIQQYSGTLLGFKEFEGPVYKNTVQEATGSAQLTESLYTLLKQELFANLPQAIKYISPLAAEQLAPNLPSLVTLNKDNLPQGFILKQTGLGELVLDYDPYLENEKTNPFTPLEYTPEVSVTPIYDIKFASANLKKWVADDNLSELFNKIPGSPKQLINMWIKYGDEGVSSFFHQFKAHTAASPNLAHFILTSYLSHLPQWDHLYENETFFKSLERISHYEPQKQMCFERFMLKTGSSRHDLSKTVVAFEVFWNELSILCSDRKVDIHGINAVEWYTLDGGNPVVYMERMLAILKNSRNLKDQFQGMKGLSLANYTAYYASQFEGFKEVSAVMEFDYEPEEQDELPFNKNYYLYKTDLDTLYNGSVVVEEYLKYREFAKREDFKDKFWLINCANELPQPLDLEQLKKDGLAIPFSQKDFVTPYKFYRMYVKDEHPKLLFDTIPTVRIPAKLFYPMGYRFIGMQESGISVSSLDEQFAKFKSQYWEYENLTKEFLASLFFTTHERFSGAKPLQGLLSSLNHAKTHKEVLNSALEMLNKLYKLDIKLNELEGNVLFQSISGMNSAEFEGLGLSKVECIEKLLTQLQQNKFATFKLFDFRVQKTSPKWPFLYALDTAEFLAQDDDVAALYHDDLLLFSGLINGIRSEVYFHKRKDKAAVLIQADLKKVQNYLHQAAILPRPNNLQYAVQVMLNAKSFFTYKQFLDACAEIEAFAEFDSKKVDAVLKDYEFTVGAELPPLFKDNGDLKALMIDLILKLEEVKTNPQKDLSYTILASQSIAKLQIKLQESWNEAGTLLSITGKIYLARVLKTVKETSIKSAFDTANDQGLLTLIGKRIVDLPDFQDHSDFEKVNKIVNEAQTIAGLFKTIVTNPYVIEHEQEFVTAFKQMNVSKMDYETLFMLLSLLTAMPQRNYLNLLNTLFVHPHFLGQKESALDLINCLSVLNKNYFPAEYLDAFTRIAVNPDVKNLDKVMAQMIFIYQKDNKDPLLEMLMTDASLSYQHMLDVLQLTEGLENHRDKITKLFNELLTNKTLDAVFGQLKKIEPEAQKNIIEIISQGHALRRANAAKQQPVDYTLLVKELDGLSVENLQSLHAFYQTTPVSSDCLLHALQKGNHNADFKTFLLEFERAPFGERDLARQFSITEVERVINQSKDLLNDSSYTYQYRKQLTEAFLFINAVGENLPVYKNKAAKELTNAEIKECFDALKKGTFADLEPFQKRLLALGLMREAMYRSTGEFPYSSQIINLIDGMMHQGDFISNIDTGQGKSLVDSMKATLLWLDSDRVDLTTSSLVDAKRDIANYGPFFKLLGIPYSATPISASSSTEDFKTDGINFSTFAQLSLFFAKAKVSGVALETPTTKVSLVTNESDYAILDDRIIYRFATADSAGVSYGQEWIYEAINDFVIRPEYINQHKTTAGEDIDDLKSYINVKAKELKKSAKIVEKFSDAQYLSWLEAALTVNYVLKENEDYVIPDEFEKKIINGVELRSKTVKVLMKDGKVSPDSTFGNGMQQLLYARLNKEIGAPDFVIEPQNKTILSANNKNLIDYYREKEGFIWGSSGTVGSYAEIYEQYTKYGFEFGKAEPHQKNKVQFHKPLFLDDEATQFNELISQLTATTPSATTAPGIVFCKDIDTAIRLFKMLEQNNPKTFPIQIYTGLGKEEDFIRKASKPGMITIATSALGRNTDIHYDKIRGLNVWHTYVDSIRGAGQKSGRTGRQGSSGEVHYLLNKQKLSGKSVEQIKTEIDRVGAIERNLNEELYDVLGYLLAQIDKTPEEHFTAGKVAFLRENWADFSAETEARFRETRRDPAYDKDVFIQSTLVAFNKISNTGLKVPAPEITVTAVRSALEQTHKTKNKYHVHATPVKIKDCIPPVDIAYHLLNVQVESEHPEEDKKAIKDKLKQMFARMQDNTFLAENSDYLRYLASTPASQKIIVEAHKEFLTDYLKEHSQKLNFFQRWFGYESKLNKLASNQNYLCMFHAFSCVPNQQTIEVDVIKSAVKDLLDEYLETSWFINSNRKIWTTELKEQISNAKDIDEVIRLLSQSQINVAKQDIQRNRNTLKSIHYFGHSRYQSTLSRALNLATSLSGKNDVTELTSGLSPLLSDTTDNTPVTDLTVDELKERVSSQSRDKANASVLASSLESALGIKNRKGPSGMLGRKGFFSSKQDDTMPDKGGDEAENTKKL